MAFVGGGVLGLLVAVLRTGPVPVLRWATRGFIELFQGTPVLMQLFLAYYGIAVATGIEISPWPAVALALTLYAGAFLGDPGLGFPPGTPDAILEPSWHGLVHDVGPPVAFVALIAVCFVFARRFALLGAGVISA